MTSARIIFGIVSALLWMTPASAAVTLFAEAPSPVTVGSDIAVRLRARLTEPINAVQVSVIVDPSRAEILSFDDTDSAIRFWLDKATPIEEGISLEGIIPGGVGPAFTDIIELGTLHLRPIASGAVTLTFRDPHIYLHQPVPTLSAVTTKTLTIEVEDGDAVVAQGHEIRILDSDIRVVRERSLNDGARTLLFDIRTDVGSVSSVMIRERWLGLFGPWRTARSPSALSDTIGVSILDVALPQSYGGVHVATVTPGPLIAIWIGLGTLVAVGSIRFVKKRR